MANEEVKLYIPENVVRQLEAAAKKIDGYTRNEIAIDVIRQCLPIWLAARESFDVTIADYLRLMKERQKQTK